MVDCLLTKKRYRADQIEPQSGVAYHFSGAEEQPVAGTLGAHTFPLSVTLTVQRGLRAGGRAPSGQNIKPQASRIPSSSRKANMPKAPAMLPRTSTSSAV